MDARILLALLVQSLILLPGVGPDEADEATQQHIKEREEMLSHKMTRLLQELEQHSLSSPASGAPRLAASQHWHIWAIAAVLVLPFQLCWWLWERCSRNNVDLERQEEQLGIALDLGRYLSNGVLHLPTSFLAMEKLVNEILQKGRTLCEGSFEPIVQSAIPMSCAMDPWKLQKRYAVYHMVVPLTAPLGHSFHLERGTTAGVPREECRIRVELECICERQQLEDRLCFLHHPEEERREQRRSMLETLCTGSYLDMEKTACWFQTLIGSAWRFLPPYTDCHLTVLPSRRSCWLKLTSAPNITLVIELVLGLREDDSDVIRSIE